MHVILINEANLPEILKRLNKPDINVIHTFGPYLAQTNAKWYYISGYYSPRGSYPDWNIVPEHALKKFEYDKDTIDTEWTMIFHK